MKQITIILLLNLIILYKGASQNYTEVLGRPTDSTITLSILFDKSVNVYWEYGTSPGSYATITPIYKTIAIITVATTKDNAATNTNTNVPSTSASNLGLSGTSNRFLRDAS